jgi:hypothetical protein
MHNKIKHLFFSILLVFPASVFAFKLPVDNPMPEIISIPQFIKSVLDIVFKIGIPVSAIFLAWAGYLFVTAQGEPAQITKARNALLWGVIGTAIVLGSWLISTAIQGTIESIAR